MFRDIVKKVGPVVPILYVDANVNQARTAQLLKKLRKFRYDYAKGMAIVCSVQNCMPVQVDKIFQEVARIKKQYNIPVYGFLLDQCTPQSYYMSSIADEIYSLPSTVFQLKRKQHKISWSEFLSKYHIKNFTIKSNENLSGAKLDKLTSANTLQFGNHKNTDISQRVYEQSIAQRISNFKNNKQLQQKLRSQIPEQLPPPILAEEALKMGLIDKFGEHYKVLSQKYPDCYLDVIKYKEQPLSIKKSLVVLTSPILLALFIFKVILKWSIIMYVWIKSKAQGKSKKEIQAEIQAIKENY